MDFIKEAKYELILGLKNNESVDVIAVLQQYYNDLVDIIKNNENKFKKLDNKQATKFILNVYLTKTEDSQVNEQIYKFFFSNSESLLDFYENHTSFLEKNKLTVDHVDYINPSDISNCSQEISFNLWKDYIKK